MDSVLQYIHSNFSTEAYTGRRSPFGMVYVTEVMDIPTSNPLYRVVIGDTAKNVQVTLLTGSIQDTIRVRDEFVNPLTCVIPSGMSQVEWMEETTRRILEAYYERETPYKVDQLYQSYLPNYHLVQSPTKSTCRAPGEYRSEVEYVVV